MPVSKKISDLKVTEIRQELKKRNLDTKGVKAQLLQRLEEAMVKEGTDPDNFVTEVDKTEDASSESLKAPNKEIDDNDSESDIQIMEASDPVPDITVDEEINEDANLENPEALPPDTTESAKALPTKEDAEKLPPKESAEDLPSTENAKDLPVTKDAEEVPAKKDADEVLAKKDAEDLTAKKDAEDLQPEKVAEDLPAKKDADDVSPSKDDEDSTQKKDAEDLQSTPAVVSVEEDKVVECVKTGDSHESQKDSALTTQASEVNEKEDKMETETESQKLKAAVISDHSSQDDDTDMDSLRLTVGEDETIGEYNFSAPSEKDDDEDMEEVDKEDNQPEESKSTVSVTDSTQNRKVSVDATPSIECIDLDDDAESTRPVAESQQCSSTASKDITVEKSDEAKGSEQNTKVAPAVGQNDAKPKDGSFIIVNGLCKDCTALNIKSVFQKHGKILGVKTMSNTKSGGLRFAHVEMALEEDMDKCVATELSVHGHKLLVEKVATEQFESETNSHVKKTVTTKKDTSDAKNTGAKEKEKEKETAKPKDTVSPKPKEKGSAKVEKEKKEKPKERHAKHDKDKTSKDAKVESDKNKSKGSGNHKDGNKTGDSRPSHPEERKGDFRKDSRSLQFDRRRFNASKPGGYHRGNDPSSSGSPYRSAYSRPVHSTSAPSSYPYRGRGGRAPPPINASRPCLTFDKIREHRERERLREHERKTRERERRRREEDEKQRMIEKKNHEEFLILERERQKLRMEREKVERDKMELIRLERERQRAEKEKIEKEREELRRAQLKIAEQSRRVLKRSYPEDKNYVDRKKSTMSDVRRFDGAGRADDFPPPRHESSKADTRMDVNRHVSPRLDRGHIPMQRSTIREFPPITSRSNGRHSDVDKDWSERDTGRDLSRIEPKKVSHAHSDDRRAPARITGRETSRMSADYDSAYRSSAPAPPKIADRYGDSRDFSFDDRNDWDRRQSTSGSGQISSHSGFSSHSAAPRSSWPSESKAEPSWQTPDKLPMSDRWMTNNSSSMASGIGVRSGSSAIPSISRGLPASSSSLYPSAASTSSSSIGRSSQPYNSAEPPVYRFRRF